MAKKQDKKVLSMRINDGNKWIVRELEKRQKKDRRPSLSNTLEVVLAECLTN